MKIEAVRERLKKSVIKMGGRKKAAHILSTSPDYVGKMMRGDKQVTKEVLDYLGLEHSVVHNYRKKQE